MLILTSCQRTAVCFATNRDSTLSLEIHSVHDALGDLLVGAECPALFQHGIDKRRLPMIDVGDNGDVP